MDNGLDTNYEPYHLATALLQIALDMSRAAQTRYRIADFAMEFGNSTGWLLADATAGLIHRAGDLDAQRSVRFRRIARSLTGVDLWPEPPGR